MSSGSAVSAAKDGDVVALERGLSASPPWDVDEEDKYGQTALILAATCGHVRVAQLLLSADPPASINHADRFGRTALMAAAAFGHTSLVRLFLAARPSADVHQVDYQGRTALFRAANSGGVETVRLLLNADPPASVDHRSLLGETPLITLLRKPDFRHADVVHALLSAPCGANLGITDQRGRSALDYAIHQDAGSLLQCMLARYPLLAGDSKGLDALVRAIRLGKIKAVEAMLSVPPYPDLERRDSKGRSLMKLAFGYGQPDIVLLLLRKAGCFGMLQELLVGEAAAIRA